MKNILASSGAIVIAALLASVAQASPVQFTFTGVIGGAQTPGISVGDTYTLKLIGDNGGSSLLSQSWTYGDLQGFTIDAGTYHASYSTPFFHPTVGFQTNGSGILTYATMYGTAPSSSNTDNFGSWTGDYVFGGGQFQDLYLRYNYQTSLFQSPANWTVSAVAPAVPEPASWALMLGGFGVVGGVMRSRRKAAATFA